MRPFWLLFSAAALVEGLLLWGLYTFLYPVLRGAESLPWLALATGIVLAGTCLLGRRSLRQVADAGGAGLDEIAQLPLRIFFLRPVLWSASVLPGVWWISRSAGLPTEAPYRLLALTVIVVLLLGGPLCALLVRLSRAAIPAALGPRYYAATLHQALFFSSVSIVAIGVLVTRVMYHSILGITEVHFRRHLTVMPVVGILAGFLWLGLLRSWTQRPRQLLARLTESNREPGATELSLGRRYGLPHFVTATPAAGTVIPDAPLVYRSLHLLPRRLSWLTFALWFLANAWTTAYQDYWFGTAPEELLLMLTLGSIMGFCLAFYALAWHRAQVRIGLRYLTLRLPLPYDEVRDRATFRTRMALSFGGLLLFACIAALLASLSQFRRASVAILAEQGMTLAGEAAEAVARAPLGVDLVSASRVVLPRLVRQRGEVLALVPAEGEPILFGREEPIPQLRELLEAAAPSGGLDLGGDDLAGGYAPLGSAGVIVALVPAARVPGLERSLVVLLSFFALLAAASLGVVFAVARDLTVPLEDLSVYAAHIAAGDLRRIPLAEGGEIGALTAAFEQMRSSLAGTLTRLDELNSNLEEKVTARTHELEAKRRELEDALHQLTEAQAQLIHSEKMATLGFLVAGIAHDINNPINAIQNNLEPLRQLTEALMTVVRRYQEAASAFEADAPDAEDTLSAAERAAKALDLAEAEADLARMLRILRNGAERTAKIVSSLRNFSRAGESRQKAVELHQGLDETVELIGHHLRQRGISVLREYHTLPPFYGDGGALNQVFMNLLSNAMDALEQTAAPEIRLRTRREDEHAVIEIEDNGPGMPPAVAARVFEPFFTTKAAGQGTGLGLSISRRIIEDHKGSLSLRTGASGTCFTIRLPWLAPGST